MAEGTAINQTSQGSAEAASDSCRTCGMFDPDVLTVAMHLQQLKRERFGGGHVEVHFTPDGAINTNAIYDVSRRKRL